MPKDILNKKANKASREAIKILIEFCITEKIENPMMVTTADVSDGSRYKLIFERVDLNENVPLTNIKL